MCSGQLSNTALDADVMQQHADARFLLHAARSPRALQAGMQLHWHCVVAVREGVMVCMAPLQQHIFSYCCCCSVTIISGTGVYAPAAVAHTTGAGSEP